MILDFLKSSHQFILTGLEGNILESCNSLVDLTPEINTSIYNTIPFLSAYTSEIMKMNHTESLDLNCIQFSFKKRIGIYDLKISKNSSGNPNTILIILTDRSNYYNTLRKTSQNNAEVSLEKELIQMQMQIITKQNDEMKTLLKETHHRIKNNLQVVHSLLKFQSRELEDLEVVKMFTETQNRVLSMALLHEKLYQSYSLKNVNANEYLKLLVKEFIENYGIDKNISFEINVGNFILGSNTLVPLGLLTNELISNSLKHGFKKQKKGHIKVLLKKISNLKYRLTIADNGIGIPKDFFENKSKSLGKKLIKTFTKQLLGNIKVENIPGGVISVDFYQID